MVSELTLPQIKDMPALKVAFEEALKAQGAGIEQMHQWIQNGTWSESRILRRILEGPIAEAQAEMDRERS